MKNQENHGFYKEKLGFPGFLLECFSMIQEEGHSCLATFLCLSPLLHFEERVSGCFRVVFGVNNSWGGDYVFFFAENHHLMDNETFPGGPSPLQPCGMNGQVAVSRWPLVGEGALLEGVVVCCLYLLLLLLLLLWLLVAVVGGGGGGGGVVVMVVVVSVVVVVVFFCLFIYWLYKYLFIDCIISSLTIFQTSFCFGLSFEVIHTCD